MTGGSRSHGDAQRYRTAQAILAVAAQLSGDMAGAREYLAYTGAGARAEWSLRKGSRPCRRRSAAKKPALSRTTWPSCSSPVNEDGSVLACFDGLFARLVGGRCRFRARRQQLGLGPPKSSRPFRPSCENLPMSSCAARLLRQEVPDVLTPLRSRFGVCWAAEILKLEDANPLAAVKKRQTCSSTA